MIRGKTIANAAKDKNPPEREQDTAAYTPELKSNRELVLSLCDMAEGGKRCKLCDTKCGYGRETIRRFGDDIPVYELAPIPLKKPKPGTVTDSRIVRIVDIIEKAIAKRGQTSYEFLHAIHMNEGLIYNWKNGNSRPNLAKLIVILDHLGLELSIRRKKQ